MVDLVYGSVADSARRQPPRSRGARVIDGLEILVHQGAASLRIWTGLEPPLETMRKAAREARSRWRPTSARDTSGPSPRWDRGDRARARPTTPTQRPGADPAARARQLGDVPHRRDRRARLREPRARRRGDPGGARRRAPADELLVERKVIDSDQLSRASPSATGSTTSTSTPITSTWAPPTCSRSPRRAATRRSRSATSTRDAAGRDRRSGERARDRRHPHDHRAQLQGRGRRGRRHRGPDPAAQHARERGHRGGRGGRRGRARRRHRAARVGRRRAGDQARLLDPRPGGQRGGLRHPLRARRGRDAGPLPRRRRALRGRAGAEADDLRRGLADQDHERARHRREAGAAGRPRQRQRRGPQGRPANHDPADPARRGGDDPHPRQGAGAALARRARHGRRRARPASRRRSARRTARSWSPGRPARASRRRSTPRSPSSTRSRATSSRSRTRSSTGSTASTRSTSTARRG